MKVSRHPVIPITFFTAIGVLAGNWLKPDPVAAFAAALVAFALLWGTWLQARRALKQRPYFTIMVMTTSLCMGLLAASLHYAPGQKFHYSRFIGKSTPLIKGVIRERLKPDDYREKYYFKVLKVNGHQASGTLLLTTTKDTLTKRFRPGDALVIAGEPEPIAKPMNPYGFDYASYMEKQGVFHQLSLRKNYINDGVVRNPGFYIGQLRESLISSFDIQRYPPEVQHTINALIFGQRQDMEKAVTDSYKDAGVMHILAISGLHFSVLFYMLVVISKPLGRLGRSGKLFQFLTILAMLWGFAFVTGLSASVVRSVVMFTFILTGKHFNRSANIYNSLAISFLMLILCNPDFLFDAGFQLSYLAVLGIVVAEPLYKKARFSRYTALNYVPELMLVSLAAQIAVLPLSLYYFGQVSLLFLLANIVVIPLSNIVLITGLAVLVLNFIWEDAAVVIGGVPETLIRLMNGFIRWVASEDAFVIRDIPFTLLLTVVLYAVLVSGVLWVLKRTAIRGIALLSGILIFQVIGIGTLWYYANSSEMIVFYNRKAPLIAIKNGNHVKVLGADSTTAHLPAVQAYRKGTFSPDAAFSPTQNFYWLGGKKILAIDASGINTALVRADILILSQSPNIHLERVLKAVKPALVIADATNTLYDIKLWSASCIKEKIPFHAVAEKGFYRIE